jgi:trimeric autotransporter adhesin
LRSTPSLDIGTTKGEIDIYPNPVRGRAFSIRLNGLEKGKYNLQLYNGIGQIIYSGTIVHNGGASTQPQRLANPPVSGVYQLFMTGEGVKLTRQLVVE